MTKEPRYEERYCAYVDVLGFTQLVSQMRNGTIKAESLRDLLKQVHSPHDPTFVNIGNTDFRIQSISDAVAISTKANLAGLAVMFHTVRQLALGLLHQGYFTRGAICKGLLYHDDSVVFGEALIKAYTLESQIAKFPRVLVTSDVVQDLTGKDYDPTFPDHVRQANDGPYFLHVLWDLRRQLDRIKVRKIDSPVAEPDLSYYAEIRELIVRRFAESVDTPKHFEKVQWFAKYWNASIINIRTTVGRIPGPGLEDKTT
jgi:hypothetical protein